MSTWVEGRRRHVLTLDISDSTSRFALLLRNNRRTYWLAEAGCPICRYSANHTFYTDVLYFIAAASNIFGATDLRSGSVPRSIRAARANTSYRSPHAARGGSPVMTIPVGL